MTQDPENWMFANWQATGKTAGSQDSNVSGCNFNTVVLSPANNSITNLQRKL